MNLMKRRAEKDSTNEKGIVFSPSKKRNKTIEAKAKMGILSELLSNNLRTIFKEKRARKRQAMHKFGGEIGIKKRINEVARDIHVMDSRAWEKRTKPTDLDYVFTILIDCSGSMWGERVFNAYLAGCSTGEALQKLNLPCQIVLFNKELEEIKGFNEVLSREKYERMWGKAKSQVSGHNAGGNNDGWAIHTATNSLKGQTGKKKYLIVFSDGQPAPCYTKRQYILKNEIIRATNILKTRPIGVGIGDQGCWAVKRYYKTRVLCEDITEFPFKIVDLVSQIVGK